MPEQETGTLYLRGVPRQLVREAKAEAARRGMSLTAFVKETLARTLKADAGRAFPEEIAPIRRDLEWFEVNKPKLLRRYRGEYVAIVRRKVVDHDTDFGALASRVFERYGVGPVAMPKVVPGERVANIPTPSKVSP